MKNIYEVIKKAADECLKVKYKKRMDQTGKEEPPWMNVKIRREIAKRRRLNKRCRNGGVDENR